MISNIALDEPLQRAQFSMTFGAGEAQLTALQASTGITAPPAADG